MVKRFDRFKKKNAGDFLARQDANMSEQQKAAQDEGAAKRKSIAKEQAAAAAADIGAQDLSGLKKMLNRKYGNLLRAWKYAFDTNNNGKISFIEFCNSCRNIGFAGSLKSLWKEMDDDESGFISIDEFCPEISRLYKYF